MLHFWAVSIFLHFDVLISHEMNMTPFDIREVDVFMDDCHNECFFEVVSKSMTPILSIRKGIQAIIVSE